MIEPRNLHIVLLQFVAAENDKLLGMVVPQHELHELLAERAGSARNQHHLFRPIHRSDPCPVETRIIRARRTPPTT